MTAIVAALAPVGMVIALGWGLRRAGFPGDALWAPAERLTYYVLFPALLVNNLANAPIAELRVATMALALAAALVSGAGLMMALRRFLDVDGPAFTSLFQGAIRLNSYAGVAAAVALYGEAGLTLAAVALAVFIPTVNVLSVVVLSRYAGSKPAPWRSVAGSVARNPLILACVAGAALNGLQLGLPPWLALRLSTFSAARRFPWACYASAPVSRSPAWAGRDARSQPCARSSSPSCPSPRRSLARCSASRA